MDPRMRCIWRRWRWSRRRRLAEENNGDQLIMVDLRVKRTEKGASEGALSSRKGHLDENAESQAGRLPAGSGSVISSTSAHQLKPMPTPSNITWSPQDRSPFESM